MNKLELKKFNWSGYKHSAVKKQFGKQLVYIGTFCIKGEYTPRAFYWNPTPDRSKNHKDYMTLQTNTGGTFVSGIDAADLEQFRYQDGLMCPDCFDVIYSVMRHDYRECNCKKIAIDGGRDYNRCVGVGEPVRIDLIRGVYELLPDEPSEVSK